MPKNFNTLRERMSPAGRERSRVLAEKYRAEMPLVELREAREMTQVHLAKILGVNQAAVSKLGHVREHAAELCESDGRRVEDHGTVPGGDCRD
jgi:predicted XRE-type DNA-binding protein